jgi:hypothetical protein
MVRIARHANLGRLGSVLASLSLDVQRFSLWFDQSAPGEITSSSSWSVGRSGSSALFQGRETRTDDEEDEKGRRPPLHSSAVPPARMLVVHILCIMPTTGGCAGGAASGSEEVDKRPGARHVPAVSMCKVCGCESLDMSSRDWRRGWWLEIS